MDEKKIIVGVFVFQVDQIKAIINHEINGVFLFYFSYDINYVLC